jgi:hypothetical protein
MQNWGGDVGDERRTRGRAASCRVECLATEYLVEGTARHHDVGHKVGHQANSLGHNKATAKVHIAKAYLAKAKGRAKGRAEATSKAKAETKAELKLKVKLK